MIAYTLRRFLALAPMMLLMTFLVFLGLELTPGDAVSFIAGPEAMANMDGSQLAALRESLGLDDPFLARYFRWLGGVLRGDFGYSLTSGVPIARIVAERLPATLELSAAALLVSTLLGSALGLASALNRGKALDQALTVAGMIGVSVPEFFFGLVSILVFSIELKWLPVGGRTRPEYLGLWDRLPHLVLPALVLGVSMTAGVMRYARASMLDALGKDFMRTARSKGLPEARVDLVHGFRAALAPIAVLIGFRLPMLIGGSVVIEQIFQWPGVGSEFLAAVRGQNYPLVMTIALLSVLAVLAASFLVDLATAALDPRVKLS
ncbi:MAG TPA: ABC transporter permease [Spirochaetales bacterium]|nr:ABC transporter permease [Spirochaetales bacterium]HRY55774.1 ABC transporter permease [Spirochaetia bacterium]HRZ63353.1 ABC transporter permease [Spirochaetia bacterium]